MINTLGMGAVLLHDNTDFLNVLLCGALISEPVIIWFFNTCDFEYSLPFFCCPILEACHFHLYIVDTLSSHR